MNCDPSNILHLRLFNSRSDLCTPYKIISIPIVTQEKVQVSQNLQWFL